MQISKATTVTLQLLSPEETLSIKLGARNVEAYQLTWIDGKDFVEVHGLELGFPRHGHLPLTALPTAIAELLREEAKK